MELKELRTFTTAARLRSISKAAEQLEIGQPTATTHIKKLEDEIGALLFDRVKRPIQLTLAGTTLARLATPLLDGIQALVAQTAAEEGGRAGEHSLHPRGDFTPAPSRGGFLPCSVPPVALANTAGTHQGDPTDDQGR